MELISWYYDCIAIILCVEPLGHGGDLLVL